MKRIFKKIAAATLALSLVAGSTNMTASAAQTSPTNGTYKSTIHFHNASNPANYSMCDSIFAHEALVVLSDDDAKVTFYVAYPIPAYPSEGIDGTIKDVTMTYNGSSYAGTSDISTKAVKTFDTTGALFGINAGDNLETQAITVTLPRESVNSFENGIDTSAFVNVVMNTTTDFVVKITALQSVSSDVADSNTDATETTTKEVKVTADIAAPSATYTVTIPEAVAFGTLSADSDNNLDYSVEVAAANLGNGYVEVSSTETGNLTSDAGNLAFANSFGSQKVSEDSTLSGSFLVKASDVKKAAAGNYTGTVKFSINYYAGN